MQNADISQRQNLLIDKQMEETQGLKKGLQKSQTYRRTDTQVDTVINICERSRRIDACIYRLTGAKGPLCHPRRFVWHINDRE